MSADFPRPSDHQYIASAKTLCVTLRVTQLTNLLQTRSNHSRELWVILPATPNFPGRLPVISEIMFNFIHSTNIY